ELVLGQVHERLVRILSGNRRRGRSLRGVLPEGGVRLRGRDLAGIVIHGSPWNWDRRRSDRCTYPNPQPARRSRPILGRSRYYARGRMIWSGQTARFPQLLAAEMKTAAEIAAVAPGNSWPESDLVNAAASADPVPGAGAPLEDHLIAAAPGDAVVAEKGADRPAHAAEQFEVGFAVGVLDRGVGLHGVILPVRPAGFRLVITHPK